MAASKITFADKVGIIAKQTRINQVWDDDVNEIKSKFNTNANLIDTNTTDIATNASDILTNKDDITDLQTQHKIGFLDYADLATQTTPISVTGGAGAVSIPNDAAGSFSILSYPPDGVTEVWDATNQTFDWSELSLGDMIDIRLNLEVTTTTTNTAVSVDLHLGSGGSAYTVPFITATNFKTAGTYQLIRFNGIYMGNTDTLNNGGVFKISSDNDITYKVIGWYCKITKR